MLDLKKYMTLDPELLRSLYRGRRDLSRETHILPERSGLRRRILAGLDPGQGAALQGILAPSI